VLTQPKSYATVYVEYHSPPDGRGRRTFTGYWEELDGIYRCPPCFPRLMPDGTSAGYRRSQLFFAIPAEHITRWREYGLTVKEKPPGVPWPDLFPPRPRPRRRTCCIRCYELDGQQGGGVDAERICNRLN